MLKTSTTIPTAYDDKTTLGTQPRKNMTTMEKVDTSDLMMIVRWVMDMSSRSTKFEWASSTYATSHIAKQKNKEENR